MLINYSEQQSSPQRLKNEDSKSKQNNQQGGSTSRLSTNQKWICSISILVSIILVLTIIIIINSDAILPYGYQQTKYYSKSSYYEKLELYKNKSISEDQFNDYLNNQNEEYVPSGTHVQLPRLFMDPETRTIRDQKWNQVLLHGVNIVVKGEPFIPETNYFHPQESLSIEDIIDLKKWGFNLVRLGVSWESVEVEAPGSTEDDLKTMYNQTYLKEIDKIIQRLAQHNIYTIIDGHQDVFAKIICGNGMPNFYAKQILQKGNLQCDVDWKSYLIKPMFSTYGVCKNFKKDFVFQRDQQGNPLASECAKNPFVLYYGSAESLELFDSLYTNKHGLQDKYLQYWEVLASRYAKDSNVIGFDPINEPMVSNFVKEIGLLYPKKFDFLKLQPLYDKIFQILYKYNMYQLIHFETAQAPNILAIGGGIVNPVGFQYTPGNQTGDLKFNQIKLSNYKNNMNDLVNQNNIYSEPQQVNESSKNVTSEFFFDEESKEEKILKTSNHILHDHFYCCQMDYKMCQKVGEPPSDAKSGNLCKDWHQRRMTQRNNDAIRLNVPLMITEFGACYNTPTCVREINQILDECERTLCSGWAYWQFKQFKDHTTIGNFGAQGFYSDDGYLQINKVTALSRPYVMETPGTLQQMSFDQDKKQLNVIFKINKFQKNGPIPQMKIFINQDLYYLNENVIAEMINMSDNNSTLTEQIVKEDNIMIINFLSNQCRHGDVISIKIMKDPFDSTQKQI